MKQYVLDEPGVRPLGGAPLPAPAPHGRWRWPIVISAVGAIVVVAVYAFAANRPEPTAPPVEVASVVPAYVAPQPPRPVVVAEPSPAPVEPLPSRVTRANGRYVIDLHGSAIGPTLAMLSEATRTTVTGSDVFVSSPARITTSFVTDSPLEAWKGVFGNVASFAMTCGHSGCAVRFVAMVSDRTNALATSPLQTLQPTSTVQTAPMAPMAPRAPPPPDPSAPQQPVDSMGEPVQEN